MTLEEISDRITLLAPNLPATKAERLVRILYEYSRDEGDEIDITIGRGLTVFLARCYLPKLQAELTVAFAGRDCIIATLEDNMHTNHAVYSFHGIITHTHSP